MKREKNSEDRFPARDQIRMARGETCGEFREVRNDLKAALCEKFAMRRRRREKRVFRVILRRAIDEIRSK